jgi:hypothetical protein
LLGAGTAAAANTILGWQTKVATSDASRNNNNTTLANSSTNDSEIAGFTLEANATYELRGFLKITATVNTGWKIGFYYVDDDTSAGYNGITISMNGSMVGFSRAVSGLLQTTSATSGVSWIPVQAIFRTVTGGTGAFRWAQNSSHSDNTTRHAGSLVSIRKIS